MAKSKFIFRGIRASLCASLFLASSTWHAHAQYNPDWGLHFRLGLLTGFNIRSEFDTAGAFRIGGGGNGRFDDGYVIRDPRNTADNLTSNWGYENASQMDEDAGEVTMHRTAAFEPSSASTVRESDEPYFGLDLVYGGIIWQRGWVRVGWDFEFGYLPIAISDSRRLTGTAFRDAYVFDVSELTIKPPPGHGGTAAGGPSIPGDPLRIEDAGPVSGAILTGSRTLDVSLFAFKLGPTVFLDLTPRWGVSFGAGPAVGFVTGEYRFSETIEVDEGESRNRGSFSDSDILYGFYVGGSVMYHAVPNGDFYVGVQYMPLGDVGFRNGGRAARLDLNGSVFVSAGFNWPF